MGSKSKNLLFVSELLLIKHYSVPHNSIQCINLLLEPYLEVFVSYSLSFLLGLKRVLFFASGYINTA